MVAPSPAISKDLFPLAANSTLTVTDSFLEAPCAVRVPSLLPSWLRPL